MPAAKLREITSTATVGETPTAAGKVVTLRAVPTREYATANRFLAGNALRALTRATDDLTADFGDAVYARMERDPQIAAALRLYKSAVLSEGVSLGAAVEDESEPDFAAAHDYLQACETMLDRLPVPIEATLRDMLSGVVYGNRVAEQVYELRDGLLALKALKVKPRSATAFVVDAFNNVLGLLAQSPGAGATALAGTLVGDPEKTPSLLPREKFAVLTFEPKDGDPRGTSLLRPAYAAWNDKLQCLTDYAKFALRFASPSIAGTVGEEAGDETVTLSDGSVQTMTAQEYLLSALIGFQNGSVASLPFGTILKLVEMTGDGAAFLNKLRYHDEEITKALLGQTLATGEGRHQSRAAAAVHQDVLALLIAEGKNMVCRMIRADILMPFLRINFGPDAAHLAPRVSLGDVTPEDVASTRTSIAALHTSGYLSPSQYPALDREANLPARSEEDLAALQAGPHADTSASPTPDALPDGQVVPPTPENTPPVASPPQPPMPTGKPPRTGRAR